MDDAAGGSRELIAALEAENATLRVERDRLRESEKMYRFSAEIGGRLVWSTDPAGNVVAVSRLFARLSGISDERQLMERWNETVLEEDRGRVLEEWARCLATGDPFLAEFRARFPDGSVRTLLSRAMPARGADGSIRRWYGSTEDIDDQKRAERARAEAEERYRLAARATKDAIWDYDIAGATVDWSEGASEIFGLSGALGRTSIGWWEDRLHPEDKLRVVESLNRVIEGRQSHWSAAYRARREDGSYAEVFDRGFIIRAPDGTAERAVGAIADLTGRRRAEAEIRRMEAELVHVSRVSAMGAMASTLAHELNQPLTAVTNFVRGARRIVERQVEGSPVLTDALQSAEASALRAGEIVRRLRELVSRGTVAVAVEHLPKLIEEAGVLAFVDEKLLGIEHRLDLDPAAQWVRADKIQVQQVLINLVRNAVEAMRDSPVREVTISTRAVSGALVEIRVADTGPGIAPEHLDSLFSQFMTTKTDGMGIGLPISRTIVEAHGGKIRAENGENGGAIFSFTLPRARRRGEDSGPL